MLGSGRELMEDVGCGFVAATLFSGQKSGAEVGSYATNLTAQLDHGCTGTCHP